MSDGSFSSGVKRRWRTAAGAFQGGSMARALRDRATLAALVVLLALAALAVLGAWWLASRLPVTMRFPRHPGDLAPKAVEARLAGANERLQSDPDDLQGLVESGAMQYLKGPDEFKTAINQLEQARRLGSLDPRIFYYLGAMYQEEGLLPFALAEYQRFVRNFPDDREARMLLAKLLYQSGRYEEAAVQYQALEHGRRMDPVVSENLGLSLLALKRFEEASKSFEPLLKVPGYELRAQFYLGQVAFETGASDKARESYRLASASGQPPAGVDAAAFWTAFAQADEKLQDWTAAKDHWDRVLQADPRNAGAKTALRKLAPKLRALKRAAAAQAKAKSPKRRTR